jgi:hypothetical protein
MKGPLPRLGLACLVLAMACASPVGVERVSQERVHRSLTASVLSTGAPSPFSNAALTRLGLRQRFADEPETVLLELHRRSAGAYESGRRFLMAELSFHHASRGGGRAWYLASALYAWAFLFPDEGPGPDPFDPRRRVAADLYNRGVTEGLREGDYVELRGGPRPLPFGTLHIHTDPAQFRWDRYQLVRFSSVAELEVRGLANRYRRPGVGAPLAAWTEAVYPEFERVAWLRVPPNLKVPVTALLRFESPREGAEAAKFRGRIELFSEDIADQVEIEGRSVPLEYEPSAALAYSLDRSEVWKAELAGYRSGSYRSDLDGLWAMHPYRRGRIPVVFVHGTASSPGRWASMLNELQADAVIGDRYQYWLFFYNTGNPILYSANRLRESLRGAVQELDPDAADPALRRMLVVGHSQGGLLTRLAVVESGDLFWQAARGDGDLDFEDLDVSPDAHELLRRALFFSPVEAIRRVVFVATPHGGSFLAQWRLGTLASKLVRLPGDLARTGAELISRNPDIVANRELRRIPTSVDNMRPDSGFTAALQKTRIAPGVRAHSIVAVKGDGPFRTGNDGVVTYESAHIDGVESELVVRSGHSTQAHPDTVEEVRRILLLHARLPADEAT